LQHERSAKKMPAKSNQISISGEPTAPDTISESYVADPEFDAKTPTKKIARKKSDIKKEIVNQCTRLIEKLNQANLPDRFVEISFNFYEKSLKDNPVFDDLKYCFFEDPKSKFKIELDVFSSSFGGRGADQVQIQVSAFEYSSSNKVFETGFQFHLEEAAE
jgi:hypothetical protein